MIHPVLPMHKYKVEKTNHEVNYIESKLRLALLLKEKAFPASAK
jgi:hypothetical protein